MYYNDYYNNYMNYNTEYDYYGNRDNHSNHHKNNLVELNEGFLRGNMFSDIYEPWSKPIPPVPPKSQREQLLRKIQELAFATNDLALYLDLNSNDSKTINIFNNYNNELAKVTKEFEERFGPLDYNSVNDNESKWEWPDNPWPWEKEANE